jgi:uncharacterized repeat protein (TIGR01451 family)
MNRDRTQADCSKATIQQMLRWLGVGLLSTMAVGCQNMAQSKNGLMVSARQSNMASRSQSGVLPGSRATLPPGVSNDQANVNRGQIADEAGQIAQVSYQAPIEAVSQNGEYFDSTQARMMMPVLPGQTPVAANLPVSGGHGRGCSCCSSSYGAYQPLYSGNNACNGECGVQGCNPALPCSGGFDPQEYIYDGGDQDPAVRIRNDYSVVGLGTEDTVVQFTTEDGKEFAETGCRTAIYAPRFASVRRITNFRQNDGVWAARATLKEQPTGNMHAPLPPIQVAEKVGARDENAVKVVEAFRDRNRGVPVLQNQTPRGWNGSYGPYEDLQLIRTGIAAVEDRVALIKYTTNAIAWSTVDELMVYVDNKTTELVESEDHPQELLTYELGGARIRLCKVASQQSANVGDTVDFTIRFDNVAEQTLSKLVIHDSLPPRLEYVADSQQSSLPASFETTPNDVGSDIIKWTLTEPLKPGTGGVVRFKCRVR